jgi:hypothetical protein
MIRTLRNIALGGPALTAMAVSVLACVWTIWWSAPQRPVEIVRMTDSRVEESNFGPSIPVSHGFLCGNGVDPSRLMDLPDTTWTVSRESNDALKVSEAGTHRLNHTLPPADYRWIAGSKVGRRLAVQNGDFFQVWDVESGAMLGQWRAPPQKRKLSLSGRHVYAYATDDPNFDVVEVESARQIVHLEWGDRMAPHEEANAPTLRSIWMTAFSPNGRWVILLARSTDDRCWLWLWDLTNGIPVWLQSVREFRDSIGATPSFDRSGRYLSLGCDPPQSLFDLSTSPPTDLSALVADVELFVTLTDRRAIAMACDSRPTEMRIFDLDRRQPIGRYAMYCVFDREPTISPDGQLAIVTEPSSGGPLDKVVHTILEWIGRPVSDQTSYRVIDLADGQTVNRFVTADRPTQFDVDLQSVWCHSCTWDFGQEVWLRYPLRSAGPPWWLWGATAVGAVLVARGALQLNSCIRLRRSAVPG